MLMYVFGGVLFAVLTYGMIKRAEAEPTRLFAKLAALSLGFITFFCLFMAAYFSEVGYGMKYFFNDGAGVTFAYNSTTNQTLYDYNDTRVGEYLAVQKSDGDIITILSGIIPLLAILLGGYYLWYYVEVGLFGRDKQDRGGVT